MSNTVTIIYAYNKKRMATIFQVAIRFFIKSLVPQNPECATLFGYATKLTLIEERLLG